MTKPLRVVFIRHAESENNTLFFDIGETDRKTFERKRQADPRLTDRGIAQANIGGRRIAELFPEARVVMTSYLTRALQTAKAVQDALHEKIASPTATTTTTGSTTSFNTATDKKKDAKSNDEATAEEESSSAQPTSPMSEKVQVLVVRDIHEVGGHYTTNDEGRHVGSPGRTSDCVLKEFPDFSITDGEGTETGWWKKDTKESEKEKILRCARLLEKLSNVAQGIQGELRPPNDIVVVVTHGDFYKTFVKWLQSIGVDKRNDYTLLENVAISEMMLVVGASDGDDEDDNQTKAQQHKIHVEFINENDNEHMRTSGLGVLPPHTLSGK